MTPIELLYETFGSQARVAKALGINRASVCRWNASKDENGSGGKIPPVWHEKIIHEANNIGVKLTFEDLYYGR